MGEFIPYIRAKQFLDSRLKTTDDEIGQWISLGAEKGGLNGYMINKFDGPKLFSFEPREFIRNDDYLKPLKRLHFLADDIEHFQPASRYISRQALIERWTKFCGGKLEALEYVKVGAEKSYLFEYHPIAGCVETEGELFRTGLFDMNDVREMELMYFPESTNVIPVSDAEAKHLWRWTETLYNGQPIDWGYWKDLNNIRSDQAAKLAHRIDPILWPDDRYAAGKQCNDKYSGEKLDNELSIKIQRLEQRLENHSSKWNLVGLVDFLGEDNVPLGMLQAVSGETEPQAEAVENDDDTTNNERKYTTWLRETWIKENSPTGAPFFKALKNYKAKEGSPIIDWWNCSINGPGIKLRTSTKEIEIPREQIQKIASKFRREAKEQKKLSSDNSPEKPSKIQ